VELDFSRPAPEPDFPLPLEEPAFSVPAPEPDFPARVVEPVFSLPVPELAFSLPVLVVLLSGSAPVVLVPTAPVLVAGGWCCPLVIFLLSLTVPASDVLREVELG
jgi:hypothetical protein